MSARANHPACPGGCGELADECGCARPNPFGSIRGTASAPNPAFQRGFASGAEDRAIGAAWGWPDESLGTAYRDGYLAGWRS